MAKYGTGETMAARVKKRAGTSTNRESDKIIVRLPEGMRHALAELAAGNGRSMNAEVVTALAMYFENERQSAAVRAQLHAPGLEIGGSTAIKGLEDLVNRLDRKLAELSKKADTDEIVRLIKQKIK
jgi:plasmid stability protein